MKGWVLQCLCLFFFVGITLADASFSVEQPNDKIDGAVFSRQQMLLVIKEVRAYWARNQNSDQDALHGGKGVGYDTRKERLLQTLAFIQSTLEEDLQKSQDRFSSPKFLQDHFEWVRWTADRDAVKKLSSSKALLKNLPADQILVTKYFVKLANGVANKTENAPYALYGVPFDEAHLSSAEGDRLQGTRFRFGKQQILTGILEKPKLLAPTLVFLNRVDLEDALLQGTVVVKLENEFKTLNVHRHNGRLYDRTKSPREQERYWYFREVKGILGYGKTPEDKVCIAPEVTVAGDVSFFGLGRIFALRRVENQKSVLRLVILGDTGGAFQENQFQLDWLSGQYHNQGEFQEVNQRISDYADAYILLKKE